MPVSWVDVSECGNPKSIDGSNINTKWNQVRKNFSGSIIFPRTPAAAQFNSSRRLPFSHEVELQCEARGTRGSWWVQHKRKDQKERW